MPNQFEYETARDLFAELAFASSTLLAEVTAAGFGDPLVGGLITLHTHRALANLQSEVHALIAVFSSAQTKSGRRVVLIDEHVEAWTEYRERHSEWVDASYHHGVAVQAHALDPATYVDPGELAPEPQPPPPPPTWLEPVHVWPFASPV